MSPPRLGPSDVWLIKTRDKLLRSLFHEVIGADVVVKPFFKLNDKLRIMLRLRYLSAEHR